MRPIRGSYLYDKKGLIATDMLKNDESRNQNYFIWKWNEVPYMKLPQERTLITSNTPSSQLFIEPDEYYKQGV